MLVLVFAFICCRSSRATFGWRFRCRGRRRAAPAGAAHPPSARALRHLLQPLLPRHPARARTRARAPALRSVALRGPSAPPPPPPAPSPARPTSRTPHAPPHPPPAPAPLPHGAPPARAPPRLADLRHRARRARLPRTSRGPRARRHPHARARAGTPHLCAGAPRLDVRTFRRAAAATVVVGGARLLLCIAALAIIRHGVGTACCRCPTSAPSCSGASRRSSSASSCSVGSPGARADSPPPPPHPRTPPAHVAPVRPQPPPPLPPSLSLSPPPPSQHHPRARPRGWFHASTNYFYGLGSLAALTKQGVAAHIRLRGACRPSSLTPIERLPGDCAGSSRSTRSRACAR